MLSGQLDSICGELVVSSSLTRGVFMSGVDRGNGRIGSLVNDAELAS